MNPDYALILSTKYVGLRWFINGDDYAGLEWLDDSPKPTQAELDAAWPEVQYANQYAAVEAARLAAYEKNSDPVFFRWQRGDATEAEWRAAVEAVKTSHPYPPAP
jgi:hypothetical protein